MQSDTTLCSLTVAVDNHQDMILYVSYHNKLWKVVTIVSHLQIVPRFQREVDRAHTLYRLHAGASDNARSLLKNMELDCVAEVNKFLDECTPGESLTEVDDLLKDIVETEVKFYK